jgi:3-methyladenine DNA glycosylase AlkD
MIKETHEVLQALKRHVVLDPTYKSSRENITKLNVLGLRLPVIQVIERKGFSFYQKEPTEILHTWNTIWNEATVHEVMYLPLFYYRRNKHLLDPTHWKTLKKWVQKIENWEHADTLCQLYSYLLEYHPTQVNPTLQKWNTSKNPWVQRASVVSTIYYANKNRKAPPLKFVFDLIEPLIPHKNPYVQKAVGWQLREAYKLNPEKTLIFLNKHMVSLSAISFSYATEYIPKDQRHQMKKQRADFKKFMRGIQKHK